MFIQNYFYGAHWATVGVAPIPARGSLLPLLATELQGRKHLLVTAHLENPQTNKQASDRAVCRTTCRTRAEATTTIGRSAARGDPII